MKPALINPVLEQLGTTPLRQGMQIYRIGIGMGWLVGLLLDVARGALLGQYALALSVVAYLTLQAYRRIPGVSAVATGVDGVNAAVD